MTNIQSLRFFWPESVLTVAVLAMFIQDLATRWDQQVDAGVPEAERHATLEALRDRMLERSYLDNLLSAVKKEMGE